MKRLMARFKDLTEEYGPVALGVHVAVFTVCMVAFSGAILTGFDVEGAAAGTGTVMAAYVATKALSPLRIMLTLAVTPLVARYIRRLSRVEDN